MIPESELIAAAIAVRERAYSPYSGFRVGAALLGADGKIHTGCNVENLSYGLTVCAERNAVGGAVAAGCREFTALVVVADSRHPISPCGACRQVLSEFGDFPVLLLNLEGVRHATRLSELFPRARTGILDQD